MRTEEEIREKLTYAKGYKDGIRHYENSDLIDREIIILEWVLNEVNNDTQILEEHNQTVDQMNCYKQALEEIKEIALKSDMLPCGNINRVCSKCNDEITNKGKRCMEYGLNKILKKISEVIDGHSVKS